MVGLTLAISAWIAGQNTQDAASGAAYEQAFRTSFRAHAIDRCMSAAGMATAAGIDVRPICVCVTDRMLATKTVEQLKETPSPDEVTSFSAECIGAHPPVATSAKP